MEAGRTAAEPTTETPVWESPLPDDLLDGVAVDDHALDGPPPGSALRCRLDAVLEHGWWPLVAWTAGLLMGAGQLSDNSFLTHLATGRLIRDVGAPTRDVFTFSSGGRPVVVQSWLASWCYAALEAVGGAGAIRMFVALLTATLMICLWRLSAPAGSLLGRIGLVSMAAMVGLLWWNERPQMIAFLAFAFVALVLAERRSPWWLVVVFAVWVNAHGSFPLGLLYVAAVLGIGVVTNRRITRPDLSIVAAVAIGVVGGAAVSPYGVRLLTFPVELLGRSDSLVLIAEWRPLDLRSVNNVVFVAEAVAIVALLAWRRSWLRFLVAAAFVGLALMAVRNVAVAALALVPLAAPALAGLGTADASTPPRRSRMVVGGAASVVLVASVIAATPSYDLGAYPTRAVDWLERQGYVGRADGRGARVLTHDYNGNYLEWRYGASANAWLDDRAELHSFETIRDYVFLLSDIDMAEVLDRQRPDLVMWQTRTPLADALERDARYRIVYRDPGTVVACRLASGVC